MNDIESLKERNARVEADKAWETSWTRKIIITFLTYIVIAAYLAVLQIEKFYLHALVPASGYFFSTLSLPFFKKLWIENVYK